MEPVRPSRTLTVSTDRRRSSVSGCFVYCYEFLRLLKPKAEARERTSFDLEGTETIAVPRGSEGRVFAEDSEFALVNPLTKKGTLHKNPLRTVCGETPVDGTWSLEKWLTTFDRIDWSRPDLAGFVDIQ